jgi:beta-N-acetylhexosaminidase
MFINFKKLILAVSAVSLFFFQNLHAYELTLEEKIGQLLIVSCPSKELTPECKDIIQTLHVGGFIYYSWANPLNSKKDLKDLTSLLQKEALKTSHKIPLYISIDQEGGVVSRLSEEFTQFPGNFAIGKSNSFKLCLKAAEAMAEEMLYAGINLNFAPVVDVIDQTTIPYIGFRSFGSDPKKVTRFAKTMLRGFHNKGLLGTLKHFPGHGSAKKDSHIELPIIDKSLEDLKKQDLVPFENLKNDTDFIMTAHVLIPCLDPLYPVTISKKALDYLKNVINYKGLIISDSLTMDGLLKQGYTLEEAAVKAFVAGCDLLLIGGKKLHDGQNSFVSFKELQNIQKALIAAYHEGIITPARLDESIHKILKSKKKLGSHLTHNDFAMDKHKQIAESIAKKALSYQFKPHKIHGYNHYFLMTSHDMERTLNVVDRDLNFLTDRIYFDSKNNTQSYILDHISKEDLIIFLSKGLKKNNQDEKIYKTLIDSNKSVFLIDLSEHEQIVTKAVGLIQTNNPQDIGLKMAINKFKKELKLGH